jgi:hypothetical protein
MATTAQKAAAKLAQEQAAAEKAAAAQVASAELTAAATKADAENALGEGAEDTGETVDAVCLRDCDFGSAGELVALTAREIQVGKAQGAIDDHDDAVAYARKAIEAKGE